MLIGVQIPDEVVNNAVCRMLEISGKLLENSCLPENSAALKLVEHIDGKLLDLYELIGYVRFGDELDGWIPNGNDGRFGGKP